jgi:ferritin
MLNPRVQEALNKQINAELFSSYLYLSMAAHFEAANLPGLASWMRAQAAEEKTHAMKIFDFVLDRGGRVALAAIDAPTSEWKSPRDVFEDVYAHERKVTGLIGHLVNLALEEKDHATHAFLQWFVNEQVEEERTASLLVDQLKLVGDSGVGLYMFDAQLGRRAAGSSAD